MARTHRLQVPVKPETKKVIEEYAQVMGLSTASACGQLLEQSAPGLQELTQALAHAKESPAKALRDMATAVSKATQEADQIVMELESTKPRRKRRKA